MTDLGFNSPRTNSISMFMGFMNLRMRKLKSGKIRSDDCCGKNAKIHGESISSINRHKVATILDEMRLEEESSQ